MEDNTNFFAFDSPKGQSSYIKVIGVGGGGGNAVNHMFRHGIDGVDFIVCNTDMKALNASPVPNKIPLGNLGLGAGNKPERASKAAEEKANDIKEALAHNTQMLFITAGMGGGTGTGAAPVIAQIAKEIDLDNDENKKILVVAIVTRPFSFEGKRRREQAEAGIEELRKYVDSIIVINNDKLRAFGDLDISEAFGKADDVLLTAAKGIAEIITGSGNVNIDFQDVNTVMEKSGTALMGAGSGTGENRAIDAITAATTSVLLDDSDIAGAKNVLLYFSYSPDHKIRMDEIGDITDYVSEKTNGTADVIWGAGTDDSLNDELKVTLIATGFEKSNNNNIPQVITLEDTVKPEPVKPEPVAPVADDEPFVYTKSEAAEEVKVESPVFATSAPVDEVRVDEALKKHVFVLEDDEPEPVAVAPAPVVEEENDVMIDGISIVSPVMEEVAVAPVVEAPVATLVETPAPAPAPAPQPVAEKVSRSAFENDNDVHTVADRIRRIHELLRGNPNGADLVQSMSPQEMYGSDLYEGHHSSARESASFTMRADGSMVKNAWLGDQPD